MITFRSEPIEDSYVWAYQDYFLQGLSRQGFIKNAHYIRAITCQYTQLLSILNNTNCINLVEVNFIMDNQPDGLPELVQLITRNARLRAVSVEVVGYINVNQEMNDFACALYSFPKITCIYLSGEWDKDTFSKFLGRVQQEPQQIKKMTFQRPESLTRSLQGPCQGRAWVARESSMMIQILDTNLWRAVEDKSIGNNGRWENEQWGPLYNGRRGMIAAVIETEKKLQLANMYRSGSLREYSGFLARLTNCHEIKTDRTYHDQTVEMEDVFLQNSNLRKIDLMFSQGAKTEKILSACNGLSSHRLHS